jgi:hypothetical protein
MSLFLSLPVCHRSNLPTERRERDERENLVFYKSFNTLCPDSFKYFPTLILGKIRNYSPFATHYSSPISDY